MSQKAARGGSNKETKLEKGEKILRHAILSGRLRPGMKLVQQDLAREIGMSPTPVREILRRLEADGLVEYVSRKGVYVSGVTASQYEERIPIRAVLEKLAVELAVPRITDDTISELKSIQQQFEVAWQKKDLATVRSANLRFHMTIYEMSDSPVLCGLIRRLWPRFSTDLLWIVPGRAEKAIQDHKDILAALEKRDVDTASNLIGDHISKSGREILDYIEYKDGNVSLKDIDLSNS